MLCGIFDELVFDDWLVEVFEIVVFSEMLVV